MSEVSKSQQKFVISLYAVIVYVLVTNQFTYRVTNYLGHISPHLATLDSNGCPTVFGYVLHMVVFFTLVRAMMEIKLPAVKDE
jgi:hypothetical protein